MLPVMFAARKLDGEDPMVVYYLRIAYGVCQSLCVMAVLYTYFQANSASAKYPNRIIYVPPAATVSGCAYFCVFYLVFVSFFYLFGFVLLSSAWTKDWWQQSDGVCPPEYRNKIKV